ncbi:putative metalloprotease CJM1_0395 family protein [Candidatus Magnetobacterium casense]|uniref:SprA-related family protein n=1 Tax=Candidatus Magnetobacterium casense TaxID=1455061 RepID=A0ABS6S2X6_9BACT|nr:putative metalloprotease CJM1_0395 family protein [Candidatus Magnetobacterium casensis]MBV6342768.1 hypothetical protein [Candidatus Magnetobacterium casensis]
MDVSVTGIQQGLYPTYGLSGGTRNVSNAQNADSVNKQGGVSAGTDGKAGGVTADNAGTTPQTNADKAREIQIQVQRLKQREQAVKAHEQAHTSVGGQYAGAPTYEYTRGPDGKNYISGGEVPIDVSKEKEPDATVRKMRQVRAAALAPADPSPQDQAIAAKATNIESKAQQELITKQFDQRQKQKDSYMMLQGIGSSETKQDVGSNVSIYV